jgi:hypothetical protein
VPYVHILPAELGAKLLPVWPPKQEVVTWPPTEPLSDDDVRTALLSVGEPMSGADIPA